MYTDKSVLIKCNISNQTKKNDKYIEMYTHVYSIGGCTINFRAA